MKVVILAGGFGTRLSEYTGLIPKPMVPVGNRPIIWHIMSRYAKYGFTDFVIALGYKAEVIKEYFHNFSTLNSDFSINLQSGEVKSFSSAAPNWNVTLVDTGETTMTGGRIKRLADHLEGEPFLLTYGDGVSDIPINDLVAFHKAHGRLVTLTAVRPPARFGELDITEGLVNSFQEKPQLHSGWINGGFFVVNPGFLELIDDDSQMLEREPLERAVDGQQLMAYQHEGFWQCMDTKRDHETLETLWNSGDAPWTK